MTNYQHQQLLDRFRASDPAREDAARVTLTRIGYPRHCLCVFCNYSSKRVEQFHQLRAFYPNNTQGEFEVCRDTDACNYRLAVQDEHDQSQTFY